jgi:uncharacterized protein (DUF433 family)
MTELSAAECRGSQVRTFHIATFGNPAHIFECVRRLFMATHAPTSTTVVSDGSILGGTPVVAGTRLPADTVLAEVRAGKSRFDIFRSYPSLPIDGIDACIAWEKAGRPSCPIRS